MNETLEQKESRIKKELSPTVFSASHSDISRTAVTQCQVHDWKPMGENEMYCAKCQSAIITKQ